MTDAQPLYNGEYKLGVESRLTSLEVTVEEIKDNHLVHIQHSIDRITWLLVTTLISALVGLALTLFR